MSYYNPDKNQELFSIATKKFVNKKNWMIIGDFNERINHSYLDYENKEGCSIQQTTQ